ncbi:MAG: hypothetical protein V4754_14015 [Pseudomonadota bacterium]
MAITGANSPVGFHSPHIPIDTPSPAARPAAKPVPGQTAQPQNRLYNQESTRAGVPMKNRLHAQHAELTQQKATGDAAGGSGVLSTMSKVANGASLALSCGGKATQALGLGATLTAAGAPVGLPTMAVGELINIAATVAGAVGTGAKAIEQMMAGDSSGAKKTMVEGGVQAAVNMI